MSKDLHLNKQVRLKQESRDIVKEVLDFGITEEQKLDIMYFITLTLENNDALKDVTSVLKKYRSTINNEKDDNNFISNKSKILTS